MQLIFVLHASWILGKGTTYAHAKLSLSKIITSAEIIFLFNDKISTLAHPSYEQQAVRYNAMQIISVFMQPPSPAWQGTRTLSVASNCHCLHKLSTLFQREESENCEEWRTKKISQSSVILWLKISQISQPANTNRTYCTLKQFFQHYLNDETSMQN